MFIRWKSIYLKRNYVRQRLKLIKISFFVRQGFSKLLIQIYETIQDVRKIYFFTKQILYKKNIWDLLDFAKYHIQIRQTNKDTIKRIVDTIVEKLLIFRKSLDDESKRDRIVVKNKYPYEQIRSDLQLVNFILYQDKSISQMQKKVRLLRFLQQENQQDKMLFSQYVRLVEYILIKALQDVFYLFQVIFTSYQIFIDVVIQQKVNFLVSYRIPGYFNQLQLIIQIDLHNFLHYIDTLFNDTMKSIQQIERFIKNQKLNKYIQDHEQIDLTEKIKNQVIFKNQTQTINNEVTELFEPSIKFFRTRLTKIIHIQEDLIHFQDPKVRKNFQDKIFEINEIKNMLSTLLQWDAQISENLKDYNKQFLSFSCQKVKNELNDHIIFKIDILKKFLHQYMRILAQKTIDVLRQYELSFQKFPVEYKEFKPFMDQIQNLKGQLDEIYRNRDQISSITKLLISVDKEIITVIDNNQFFYIQENLKEIVSKMEEGEEYIKNIQEEYQERFNKSYDDLKVQVGNLINVINQGNLVLKQPVEDFDMAFKDHDKVKLEIYDLDHHIKSAKMQHNYLQEYKNCMSQKFDPIQQLQVLDLRFQDRKNLWINLENLNSKIKFWTCENIRDINVNQMMDILDNYQEFEKALKIRVRNLNSSGNDHLFNFYQKILNDFNQKAPLIINLANPDLQSRHFDDIFEKLDQRQTPEKFTYYEIVQMGANYKKDYIENMSQRATGESLITKSLYSIQKKWDDCKINFEHIQDLHTYQIINIPQTIEALQDDEQSLNAFLSTRFITYLKNDVNTWINKIRSIQKNLNAYQICQKSWIYLENIFMAQDIQEQMIIDYQALKKIDKTMKNQIVVIQQNPLLLYHFQKDDMFSKMKTCNKNLEEIQRHLNLFLSKIRTSFPRFFQLSSDDLLLILSDMKEIKSIQRHLKKLFDNISSVKFADVEQEEIQGLNSIDPVQSSEYMEFKELCCFPKMEKVENIFKKLELNMIMSLQHHTKVCAQQYAEALTERLAWFFKDFPAQCVLVVEGIFWTKKVEKQLLVNETLQNLIDHQERLIIQSVQQIRKNITLSQRILTCSSLIQNVHFRDILSFLQEKEVKLCSAFEWQSQLKYAINNDWLVDIRQCSYQIEYSYEYLGNQSRLVLTPLTDQCILTITTALKYYKGGCPQGPAGTGKTETVKDLAKSCGQYCIVYNCSQNMDFVTIQRIISGTCFMGNWVCMDEVNRVQTQTLSLMANTIQTYQLALQTGQRKIKIADVEISLNPKVGVFVTMNPTYKGRQSLPDNLKALFRPVCMMIPNLELIAEILLLGDGFSLGQEISKKIVYLFQIAQDQLSKQIHYDFGLRTIKNVLFQAGAIRRQFPESFEDNIIVEAIKITNYPKLVKSDLGIFNSLLTDLFPNAKLNKFAENTMVKSIKSELDHLQLKHIDAFIEKVEQVEQMIWSKNGIIFVGETLSGKSTCLDILYKIYEKSVSLIKINPKSIQSSELFGFIDESSKEWQDGIISYLVKSASKSMKQSNKQTFEISQQFNVQEIQQFDFSKSQWLMLDGPIHSSWIENLNSSLDDNKLLSLDNGQRIKLPFDFKFLFETDNMQNTSPATVSRCGIAYFQENMIGWKQIIEKNYKTISLDLGPRAERTVTNLKALIINLFTDFEKENQKLFMENQLQILAQNCIDLMVLLTKECITSYDGNPEKLEALSIGDLDMLFQLITNYALIWSYYTNLYYVSDRGLRDFHQNIKQKIVKVFICYPMDGDFNDFYIDYKLIRFVNFKVKVQTQNIEFSNFFNNLVVPNIQLEKYSYMIDKYLQAGKNVFVAGEQASGKTLTINKTLSYFKQYDLIHSTKFFSFSNNKSVNKILYNKKLFQVQTNFIRIQNNQKLILFIDDCNMPEPEFLGSQSSIEVLRQLLEHNMVYEFEEYKFIQVDRFKIVAAANWLQAGKSNISYRFMKYFHMIWIPELNRNLIESIYQPQLQHFFQRSPAAIEISEVLNQIVVVTQNVFNQAQQQFIATPSRPHYIFTFRNIIRVFSGLFTASPFNIESKQDLAQIWNHEILRNFQDNLIYEDEKISIQEYLSEINKNVFNMENLNQVLYTPFIQPRQLNYNKYTYQKLADYVQDIGTKAIGSVFIFSPLLVQQILSIIRALLLTNQNLILIGIPGLGKRTLIKIAAIGLSVVPATIDISKGYSEINFKEDLKTWMKNAGCRNEMCLVILQDTSLQDHWLEIIQGIIDYGNWEELFRLEDWEEIYQAVRSTIKEKKVQDNTAMLVEIFHQRVKKNLKFSICISPVGNSLRIKTQKVIFLFQFPVLFSLCTINYLDQWPRESILQIAYSYLKEMDSDTVEKYGKKVPQVTTEIHFKALDAIQQFRDQGGNAHVSPIFFIQFMIILINLYSKHNNSLPPKLKKYNSGIHIIKETNKLIDYLKKELLIAVPKAKQQYELNKMLMEELITKFNQAEYLKIQINEEREIISEKRQIIADTQQKNQEDSIQAQQILQDCHETVRKIKRDHLIIIKSYNNPPSLIVLVLKAVSLLFEVEQSWIGAKRDLLGDLKFLEKLIDYNVEGKQWLFDQLRTIYIPMADFNFTLINRQSEAAGYLCKWVFAIDQYQKIKLDFNERQEKLHKSNTELIDINKKLDEKVTYLRHIEANLKEITQNLQKSTVQCDAAKKNINDMNLQMSRSKKLLNSLETEEERWIESQRIIQTQFENLMGNIILASSLIVYLAPLNNEQRQHFINIFRDFIEQSQIKIDYPYQIQQILMEENDLEDLLSNGLPNDQQSIQNAIILQNTQKWPLIIDPQNQGTQFLKQYYSKQKIVNDYLNKPEYFQTLPYCLQFGIPIILQNIQNEYDPILEPLITKQFIKNGQQYLLQMGDKQLVYHQSFKLFLQTKEYNPQFLPEICSKVTLINFSVTQKGLEEQILSHICSYEKADLEIGRKEAIQKILLNKSELNMIENIILSYLEQNSQNVLRDDQLLEIISKSQVTYKEINQRVIETTNYEQVLTGIRDQYRPIAQRASILYFTIMFMTQMNNMYIFSLKSFMKIFQTILEIDDYKEEIDKRAELLVTNVTEQFHKIFYQGMFSNDKLLYSFIVGFKILECQKMVNLDHWNFLIYGTTYINPNQQNSYDFLTNDQFNKLSYLRVIDKDFKDLFDKLSKNSDLFKAILTSRNPWQYEIPIMLNPYQKIMVLFCLRPDSLIQLIRKFVSEVISERVLKSSFINLNEVLLQSSDQIPILIILNNSSDPFEEILRFATQKKKELINIQINDIGAIPSYQIAGKWVFIENLHLNPGYWVGIANTIIQLQEFPDKTDFRLFLSTNSMPDFPNSILIRSVKLIFEPLQGFKSNLNQFYKNDSQEFFEMTPLQQKMIFKLSIFHIAIQGRKKYDQLGWIKMYDWMKSDYEISKFIIKDLVKDKESVPLIYLWKILANIIYGGRISEWQDTNLIESIIKIHINMNDEVFSDQDLKMTGYTFSKIKEFIQELQQPDSTEKYNLHANAEIDFNKQSFFQNLKLYFQVKKTAYQEQELQIQIQTLFTKLQPYLVEFPILLAYMKELIDNYKNQELQKYNILIKTILSSLNDINQSFTGEKQSTQQIDLDRNSITQNLLPQSWKKVSYMSEKNLSKWIEDFIQRIEFLRKWADDVYRQPYYLLPAFYYPIGFLNSMKSLYSRQKKIPIDELEFEIEINNFDSNPSKQSQKFNISGLYIQGAIINTSNLLLDEYDNQKIYNPIPIITFTYQKIKKEPQQGYKCPLYITKLRRDYNIKHNIVQNFIANIYLPCTKTNEHWIIRGVALFCQNDD